MQTQAPVQIVVIGLVPRADFLRFLRDLRARYPEAAVTAVVGTPELQVSPAEGAQECLLWTSLPARAFLQGLRQRRADLLVLAYNPEYCYTFTYWKALLLATFSRSRALLFCERGKLPERIAPVRASGEAGRRIAVVVGTIFRQLARRIALLAVQALVLLPSLLLALLVLVGVAVVDGLNVVLRALGGPGRKRAARR